MTEQAAVPVVEPAAVPEPPEAPVVEEDPFKGLESEAFDAGVLIEDEPAAPTPVREVVDDPAPAEPDPEPVKPKQTAQERINELTRLRREAERKAEALEARLQEMEKPAEPATEPAKPTEPEPEGPPDPTTYDYGELDPRYITALVEYQTDQRIDAYRKEEVEKAEQQRAIQQQQDVQERFMEKLDAGVEKHEDFREKVIDGAEKGEWALSAEMGEMLADSEVGDDIAYHLATHPDESLEVFRQTPVEQARYFGKMEAKFSADQAAAQVKPEAKPPKAPPPVKPARGSDGKFQPSADSEDFSAFERVATAQE